MRKKTNLHYPIDSSICCNLDVSDHTHNSWTRSCSESVYLSNSLPHRSAPRATAAASPVSPIGRCVRHSSPQNRGAETPCSHAGAISTTGCICCSCFLFGLGLRLLLLLLLAAVAVPLLEQRPLGWSDQLKVRAFLHLEPNEEQRGQSNGSHEGN